MKWNICADCGKEAMEVTEEYEPGVGSVYYKCICDRSWMSAKQEGKLDLKIKIARADRIKDLEAKLAIATEALEEMKYTKLNYMIDGKPVSKYPARAALDKIKDMK